ncbi:MAG: hypothetical protein D6760_02890, partial [Deltaproteobacteria bacterium]
EGAAEVAVYAPFLPLVAARPVFGLMGLDEGKNADDEEKAALAYEGMTKDELLAYVGEPKERYRCESLAGAARPKEVWVYENDKVIRGARAMFLELPQGVVYHTSEDTSFFKKSEQARCSLLEK